MTDQTKEELTATIQVLLIEIETASKRAAQAIAAFGALLDQIEVDCIPNDMKGWIFKEATMEAHNALNLLKNEHCDHDWQASDLICKKCHRGLTWAQGNMPIKFDPCNCKRGC